MAKPDAQQQRLARHSLTWVAARDDAPELAACYLDGCGFRPTTAGLLGLG